MKATVPDGQKGPWRIETFTITPEQSDLTKFRAMLKQDPSLYCPPGTYKKLVHEKRGIVMSDTKMEQDSNLYIVNKASGDVLINGLGLGMVLEAVIEKPEVNHVTVVELDQDVIDLVAPHMHYLAGQGRLTIIQADAYDHKPPKGVHYNAVWHDIWDDISPENFAGMVKLRNKYAKRADWQGFWSEELLRRAMCNAGMGTKAYYASLTKLAAIDSAAHEAAVKRRA